MKKILLISIVSVFLIMVAVVGIYISVYMRALLSDNLMNFEKVGMNAGGYPYSTKEGGFRLTSIEIDLTKVGRDFLHDIWIELPNGDKGKLAELTPQYLKEHGFNESIWDNKASGCYASEESGFSFKVDADGILIKTDVSTGMRHEVHGVSVGSYNPRMGSFLSGKSVALPSSVPEFESVFGKPDKMYSYHVN